MIWQEYLPTLINVLFCTQYLMSAISYLAFRYDHSMKCVAKIRWLMYVFVVSVWIIDTLLFTYS